MNKRTVMTTFITMTFAMCATLQEEHEELIVRRRAIAGNLHNCHTDSLCLSRTVGVAFLMGGALLMTLPRDQKILSYFFSPYSENLYEKLGLTTVKPGPSLFWVAGAVMAITGCLLVQIRPEMMTVEDEESSEEFSEGALV